MTAALWESLAVMVSLCMSPKVSSLKILSLVLLRIKVYPLFLTLESPQQNYLILIKHSIKKAKRKTTILIEAKIDAIFEFVCLLMDRSTPTKVPIRIQVINLIME